MITNLIRIVYVTLGRGEINFEKRTRVDFIIKRSTFLY